MIRTLLKPLSFLPALMLMYMIYSFSAQPGEVSSEMSYKVSYKLVQTADYVFDGGHEDWQLSQWAGKINFITRKLAHMTEYFLLAIAVSFPLYVYGLHGFLLMLTAGIICVGFACGDEYHQSFISGRSPAVKDVCIDSFGVFWGIILVRIIGWTGRKTIFRPRPEKKHFKRKNAAACAYEYKQGPDWEEAPVRPKKKRFGRKTKQTGEPQGGYPSENDYGPQGNYYDPENSFRPQDGYCNPDQGSHYGPRNGYYNPGNNYGPQNGYYDPDNSYGPQNGYYDPDNNCEPQNGYYDPDNNFGPQNNPAPGYGPEAPVKKKKKEKDWIFDDFV